MWYHLLLEEYWMSAMLITAQGFYTLLLSISTIVSNDLFLTDVDGDLLRNIGFVQFQPLNQLSVRVNHLLFKWLFLIPL